MIKTYRETPPKKCEYCGAVGHDSCRPKKSAPRPQEGKEYLPELTNPDSSLGKVLLAGVDFRDLVTILNAFSRDYNERREEVKPARLQDSKGFHDDRICWLAKSHRSGELVPACPCVCHKPLCRHGFRGGNDCGICEQIVNEAFGIPQPPQESEHDIDCCSGPHYNPKFYCPCKCHKTESDQRDLDDDLHTHTWIFANSIGDLCCEKCGTPHEGSRGSLDASQWKEYGERHGFWEFWEGETLQKGYEAGKREERERISQALKDDASHQAESIAGRSFVAGIRFAAKVVEGIQPTDEQ